MLRRITAILLLGASAPGVAAVSGCQSAGAETPAVLASGDAETLGRVRAALAHALNRGAVELGPGDLTQTSMISVLPPPLGPHEDRSVAMPIQFELVLSGERCIARRQDASLSVELAGVVCRPRRP